MTNNKMAKLTMLSGLPASGKSTKAKELMEASGNTIRVNKDLLRTMLHFDEWTGRNEANTKDAERCLAREFLRCGINVIVDDTNLASGNKESWRQLAEEMDAKFEHLNIGTSLDECLERDWDREKSVGRDVIIQVAMRSGLVEKPEKGYVLCDLDGTLADIRHRLHFVNPEWAAKKGIEFKKDWKAFFARIPQDTLRSDTYAMIKEFAENGYTIVFVSARSEDYREVTKEWLNRFIEFEYLTLILRRSGDSRPDTEAKNGMLDAFFPHKEWIYKVVDDRPSVIRMWRENGLDVIDVGPGKEF